MLNFVSKENYEILRIKLNLNMNRFFSIPEHILPEIKSSATIFGYINKGALQGIPVTAVRHTDLIVLDFPC